MIRYRSFVEKIKKNFLNKIIIYHVHFKKLTFSSFGNNLIIFSVMNSARSEVTLKMQ